MNGFLRGFAGVLAPLHRLFSASHSDVDASVTPTDGDALTYVAATGKWTPQAPSGGGGGWQLVYDHTVPMGGEDSWTIPWPDSATADLRALRYRLSWPSTGVNTPFYLLFAGAGDVFNHALGGSLQGDGMFLATFDGLGPGAESASCLVLAIIQHWEAGSSVPTYEALGFNGFADLSLATKHYNDGVAQTMPAGTQIEVYALYA